METEHNCVEDPICQELRRLQAYGIALARILVPVMLPFLLLLRCGYC